MEDKNQNTLLEIPRVADGEVTKYQLLREQGGEVLAHQTRVVNKVQKNGNDYYTIHGLNEYLGKGVLEETVSYQIKDRLKLVSYSKQIRSRSGSVLINEECTYEDELIEFPPNTLGQSCGATFAFRGGPFVPGSIITYHWSMPLGNRPMRIHAEISTDTITVPAGTFECYKLVCTPDVDSIIELTMPSDFNLPPGFHMLMSTFAPPNHCWFTQSEPHYMVRVEGTVTTAVPFVWPDPSCEELISIER